MQQILSSNLFFQFFLLALGLTTVSCQEDNFQPESGKPVDQYIHDLNNNSEITGEPTKNSTPIYFSFSQNKAVGATEVWDIAFTGMANATVLANSQADTWLQVVNVPYEQVYSRPSLTYDLASSGNGSTHAEGWFRYDMNSHVLTPIAGKTIFIKTGAGQVYKLSMISVYKGAPLMPTADDKALYLSFRFAKLY